MGFEISQVRTECGPYQAEWHQMAPNGTFRHRNLPNVEKCIGQSSVPRSEFDSHKKAIGVRNWFGGHQKPPKATKGHRK
jgi:hypothetical protein